MEDDVEAQRQELTREWKRLEQQQSQLAHATAALEGSGDAAALRAHASKLRLHHEELAQWQNALERFHASHGPLKP